MNCETVSSCCNVNHVAEYDARGDRAGVNAVFSAGLIFYIGVALLLASAALLAVEPLLKVFSIEEAFRPEARMALRIAIAASAGSEVIFQRTGIARGLNQRLDGFFRQAGTTEVGVQHGTGQVQHRHQPGPVVPLEQPVAFVEEDDRVERGPRGAQAIDSGTYALERERAAMPFDQPLAFG